MRFEQPRDIETTLHALEERPEATLLAGGTDLMVGVNFGELRPEEVISLRAVDELRAWDGDRVGAGVSYTRMEAGPHPALAELARTVGSPQIRNAGTLGGNLGTASPAGDALPFLAAVGAEVELASTSGTRRLRWDEFLVGPKRNARRPGELITAAILPDRVPERQAFGKVGVRNAMVIAMVSAVVLRDADGTTRVALGAVGPTVLRARRAEELASASSRLTDADLAEFAGLVADEVAPISDHRATAAYRRHAAGVLARRLLERVLA